MVRNIIISLCLILLFGCKELYFKYPQPRGGKVFNGNIKQMLNSAIPATVNSDDRNSILNEIINDTIKYISINNSQNHFDLELQFYNGITIFEKFNSRNFIDSFFTDFKFEENDESIILEKENIICINKKNEKDDSIYKIHIIFERNRNSNDINLYMSPFSLRDIEKFADKMKNEFSISEYYDNDSSKVYVADPSYMSFRKYLKNHDELELEPIIFTDFIILELFNQLDDRINSDSTKYENIKGLVNFKNISELY
tara:strand:+ start:96 stop:860 length:765 start_codon:yes stop_codon:yes gene_type:complete